MSPPKGTASQGSASKGSASKGSASKGSASQGSASQGSASPTTLAAARSPGRAVARLAKQVEHGLGELEVSLPQYRVMTLLAEGSTASSSLADRLAVSPPSVTSVVDGLVARGLVERHPDPGDRRRLNLELTPAGQALLVQADASVGARLDLIVARLDRARAEQALEALTYWHEALDAYREERRRAGSATPRQAPVVR
jgi:DNA-binding MarR family transcriptional regulator